MKKTMQQVNSALSAPREDKPRAQRRGGHSRSHQGRRQGDNQLWYQGSDGRTGAGSGRPQRQRTPPPQRPQRAHAKTSADDIRIILSRDEVNQHRTNEQEIQQNYDKEIRQAQKDMHDKVQRARVEAEGDFATATKEAADRQVLRKADETNRHKEEEARLERIVESTIQSLKGEAGEMMDEDDEEAKYPFPEPAAKTP